MFKRAMKSNHWMAIGLEKWNELESMEISPAILKKMRKLRDSTGSDSEDEHSESESSLESVSDSEEAPGDLGSSSYAPSANHTQEEESVDESEDEEEEEKTSGGFEFCPICPGRKFLTEKDMECHMQSAKHLKRERALSLIETPATAVSKAADSKLDIPTKVESNTPVKLNRRARRAHLEDSRN
jgi:hypothetical protein